MHIQYFFLIIYAHTIYFKQYIHLISLTTYLLGSSMLVELMGMFSSLFYSLYMLLSIHVMNVTARSLLLWETSQ